MSSAFDDENIWVLKILVTYSNNFEKLKLVFFHKINLIKATTKTDPKLKKQLPN